MKKTFLCKSGIYKWSKTKFYNIKSFNVKDY